MSTNLIRHRSGGRPYPADAPTVAMALPRRREVQRRLTVAQQLGALFVWVTIAVGANLLLVALLVAAFPGLFLFWVTR